jgi:LPS export ABC transporter protein LptC
MILAFMPVRALRIAAAFAIPLGAAAAVGASESAEAIADTLEIEGMRFVASTGAANDAIVEAERARYTRSANLARLDQVRARVGKAAGAGSASAGGLELECERGSFDLASGDLTAEGNVRGVTEDGRRFETQRLVYQRSTGRVSTRSPVVIRDAFGTARGAGFEYFVRENRFRLIGGASVEQGP